MVRYISLCFDVEDPYNEPEDDAVLQVVEALDSAGIRGSFCITGAKCLSLLSRDRKDVLAALRRHALGLHTYQHSVHPTLMELVEGASWEEGISAVRRSERPGYEAFVSAFGRNPSFWGGAGNTWTPHVVPFLDTCGIKAQCYGITHVPRGEVHRYMGKLTFPGRLGLNESELTQHESMEQALERNVQRLTAATCLWEEVFLGHTTRYRFAEYWDKRFYHGETTLSTSQTALRSKAEIEQMRRNFERFILRLSSQFEVKGLDELAQMEWTFRPLEKEELKESKAQTEANIRAVSRWIVHKPELDVEGVVREALARSDSLEIAVDVRRPC